RRRDFAPGLRARVVRRRAWKLERHPLRGEPRAAALLGAPWRSARSRARVVPPGISRPAGGLRGARADRRPRPDGDPCEEDPMSPRRIVLVMSALGALATLGAGQTALDRARRAALEGDRGAARSALLEVFGSTAEDRADQVARTLTDLRDAGAI